MSKALVIKGANFSANKVETVTLSSAIPCTGLTLSQDSMSPTSLGVAGTLTATPTPAGTTDPISWTSSDTDVATVDNGVVTVVGLGTATITAICGSETASCSVNVVSISETLTSHWDDLQFSSTDLTTNPPKNYASVYVYAGKGRIYASETPTPSGIKAFAVNPTNYPIASAAYPIMMPRGTDIIEVTLSANAAYAGKIYFFDSTQEETYVQDYDGALVKQYTSGINCVNKVYTFTRTEEADSYAIQVAHSDITAISDTATVTYKKAAS